MKRLSNGSYRITVEISDEYGRFALQRPLWTDDPEPEEYLLGLLNKAVQAEIDKAKTSIPDDKPARPLITMEDLAAIFCAELASRKE